MKLRNDDPGVTYRFKAGKVVLADVYFPFRPSNLRLNLYRGFFSRQQGEGKRVVASKLGEGAVC